MASASQQFGNLTAGNGNYIFQGIQNAPLTSALERKQFRHGNPPPLNRNFLGRNEEIAVIKAAFREADAGKQKRYVIYGMAGIGKSEICIKLINDMQSEFWGVFWVDVSDFPSAEGDFKFIANQIRPGTAHQNLGHSLSALAEVDFNTHPWLLVLDNADQLREDYARFFPSAPGGSILLTSRNHECAIHETVGCRELESVSFKDSVLLLLKAAKVRQRDWESYRPQAETIAGLLGSHTLTLVQASAFISRDVRNWNEYPKLFKKNRQHLLATSWNQAQSKYGNVYATFEVSTRMLESDERTEAKDALCLLGIFAMFHHSGFPTCVFEGASKGLVYARTHGYGDEANKISTGLANLLPDFMSDWRNSRLRLQTALYCLEALSFIKQASMDDQDGVMLVSMHPLAHSWAKDRLDQRKKEQTWMMTGSIIALSMKSDSQYPSFWDYTMWQLYTRQLQSHISSFMDNRGTCRPQFLRSAEHFQMHYAISILLRVFLLFREQESFLYELFWSIDVEPSNPERIELLPLHQEMALSWSYLQKYPASIDLWKRIIMIEEAISFHEAERLSSRHELASVYICSGETTKAIAQLESIVSIQKDVYPADNEYCLASQYQLGRAYLNNDQVEKAIELLDHVVQIQQRTLPESSSHRLVSECELGCACLIGGQVQRALELFEHVVRIQRRMLPESSLHRLTSERTLGAAYYHTARPEEALQLFEHVARITRATVHSTDPNHLGTLSYLLDLYIKSEQPEKAREVVVEFDNALRSLPMDDARWREHGEWLAGWKQYFHIEEKPQALSECGP